MKRLKRDFAKQDNADSFYDLFDDYDLIEASFAQQYGIRLRYEDTMPWGEFVTLLVGISEDTPLGKIVSIRSEEDKDMLKHFSTEQKRIRTEWRNKKATRVKEFDYNSAMNNFKSMFMAMAEKEVKHG